MADITLPCWSFPPNWSGGVLEALEWKSSVAQSPKGTEQRRMLRLSPRRVLEFDVLGIGPGRTTIDLAAWAAGGSEFNLPLWWDYARLTASASASATVLMMDTTYSEFEAGGLAFVQGPDADTFDVVEIATVAADRLNLVAPGVSRTWAAGTRVFPMRQAMFQDQPQATRHSDKFATYQCSFVVTEKNVFQAVAPTDTYLGYKVYREAPNEAGSLTTEWSRLFAQTDNGSGIPYRVDTARYGIATQKHEFFIKGRTEHVAFRKLLYWLRGRVRPVWVPTFSIDMRLRAAASSAATTLTIDKVGVAAYVNFAVDPDHPEYAYPGRRHIMLQMRDESAIFALMNGAVDNLDGTETITLSAALGVDVDPADIKRISFIALMRLDQDRVEINHHSDQAGVSQSVVSFITTPENRQADAWTVEDWEGVMTAETCVLCEKPSYERHADILLEGGGYNPILHEIWAASSEEVEPFNQMAYRFLAGSLEPVGTVTVDNPDIPAFDYFMGIYTFPVNFVPDYVNRLMWAVAQVRVAGVAKFYVFKFDMETGETLAAKNFTGVGFGSVGTDWRIHVDQNNGNVWMTAPYSGSAYFHRIDPATMTAAETYSIAHVMFHQAMSKGGDIYYGRQNAALNHGEVWKFDTTTHSFAQVHLNTDNPPYTLVADTTRDILYIVNNFFLVATAIQVFNTATDTLTGQNLPQPDFTGDGNIAYDAINDVLWGITWSSAPYGKFNAISVSDGSDFGEFDPAFMGYTDELGSFVNTPVVPQVTPLGNSPNALYVQGGRYFDPPTNSDYGYAIDKIPMCNLYHPGDPLPAIAYGLIYDEGQADDIGVRVPSCPFSFKFFGRDLNSNTTAFFVGSNSYFNTDKAVTIYTSGTLAQPVTWKNQIPPAAAVVAGGADRSVRRVYATVESDHYKLRFEGRYTTPTGVSDIFWELKFYQDGTFTLWSDATAGTPATSFYAATAVWALMSGTSTATAASTYGGGFEADYKIPIVQNKTFRFTRGEADGNTWKCEQID